MEKKMKKWIKITGITAAVCIGAGLICFVSGVFAGAKSGVFISRRGIELEGSAYSDERYGISQIKDIEIEADDAKVEIKPSQDDTFGYSVTYEDTHSTPQVTVDNGKIRIEEKTSGGFWILDFGFAALFENRENVVTVYVPEKAALDTVKINTSNGKVTADALFTTQNLNVQSDNGKIELMQMICEKNAQVHCSNGKITVNAEFKGESLFSSNNGKVELAGAWEGTVTCKTDNGKIQVTAPKPESAYRVEAHTDNGSVYVNDNKVLNPYTAQNTQADTNLYAVSNNGSVRLEFAN